MKRSFLYLTLLMGLVCWGVAPTMADDDKKLSKAEKRELKKKEREAKRAAKKATKKKGKKSEDKDDDDEDADKKEKKKDDEKADKKAVSDAFKKLEPAYGRARGNGKFFLYADYNLLMESGDAMLEQLAKSERAFKAAKVNVLLINNEVVEEDEAVKSLKKRRMKYPMVMKSDNLQENLPGYTAGTAPQIIIVDGTGKVKAKGGAELLESWHSVVGAKAPKKASDTDQEENEDNE